MTADERENLRDLIQYFWEDKGDIERSFSRDTIGAEFPEILKAWDDFKLAEKVLTAVIRGAK